MKKRKLLLSNLTVTSFVTSIDRDTSKTIVGGNKSQMCSNSPCKTDDCDTNFDTCSGEVSVQRSCVGTLVGCLGGDSVNCNVTVVGCSRIC